MILKRVLINNEEAFVETTLEDALYQERGDLVFTEEKDREAYLDALEEREEAYERWYERAQEEEEEKEEGHHFRRHGNSDFRFDTVFSFLKKRNKKGKHSLLAALPFMEDEDIHELVQDILENGEIEGLPLVAIMPFLEEEDCDALFMKAVVEGDYGAEHGIAALAPFVSEECFSALVDAYLEGKYPGMSFDALYPFMDSKDIKRIFRHYMEKRKEESPEEQPFDQED